MAGKKGKQQFQGAGRRFRGDIWLDQKVSGRTMAELQSRGIKFPAGVNVRQTQEFKTEYKRQLNLFRQQHAAKIAAKKEAAKAAQAAAQQLKEIGMAVSVEVPAQVDWGGQMAYLIGWGSPFDADDHTYKVFGTDKGANYSSYSNELVDQYLTEARQSDDPEVRKEAYAKFQEELAKDPAAVMEILRQGSFAAQAAAAETLAKVKHAMKIDYFA